MTHTLTRTAFSTSRLLEFFTESELTTQIGYGRKLWLVVLAKELIDNSLDACESAGIAPEITLTLEADALIVSDNGPGLPAKTVEQSLNYAVRVSDKKHYISPTRGQLGNALKCLWAAPFVVSGSQRGFVEVTACGLRHSIEIGLNRITQEPIINRTERPFVQNGTSIKAHWPSLACSNTDSATLDLYNVPVAQILLPLIAHFAAFNPHATFRFVGPQDEQTFVGSDATWTKWLPNQPTSAHWYGPSQLRDLISAYIADESTGREPRTVREFVSEFDGLRRSRLQMQVTKDAGVSGYLHDLAKGGDIPLVTVENLLAAMKQHSRPVNPDRLGVIGKKHALHTLVNLGAEEASFKYKKLSGTDSRTGLPFLVETALGRVPKRARTLLIGLNYSPVLKVPSGYISDMLSNCHVQHGDPIVLLVHQACPSFPFTSHGKGDLVDSGDSADFCDDEEGKIQ